MKLLVFGVTNWDNKMNYDIINPTIKEWKNRVQCFCNDPEIFITTGSYSDDSYNTLNIPIIQNGIQKTQPYSRNWNYFRNGFITGCWHSLLNKKFDVLLHVQCRTYIGQDIMNDIYRFYHSNKQIMAPRYISKTRNIDNSVEVGFMAMKPDAVKLYVSSALRQSLTCKDEDNCEIEAYKLFKQSWYNPYPYITTIRQRESGFGVDDDINDLPYDDFIKLPIIAAGKHTRSSYINDWCIKHPYRLQ